MSTAHSTQLQPCAHGNKDLNQRYSGAHQTFTQSGSQPGSSFAVHDRGEEAGDEEGVVGGEEAGDGRSWMGI